MATVKQLRLAIDGNEANVLNRVGSNTYAFELLRALEALTRNHTEISCTILLATPPIKEWPKTRPGWQYLVVPPKFFWTQLAAPWYLFWHSNQFDVFFTPGHYAPRFCPIPYISSVMDLAYEHTPEQFKAKDLFQLQRWTKYSVKHASKVITISEASKKDIISFYSRSPEDVVVAYPGAPDVSQPILLSRAKAALRRLKIKPPYILYVGTLQPRKNLPRLVEAFERLFVEEWKHPKIDLKQLKLVIAGKVGWLADKTLERIAKSPHKDSIILTGYVDDLTKQILYQNAVIAVSIGLYEGFGIPALEAILHGALPVVSNTSSLPEVVGRGGIFVDPEQVSSISRGLMKGLQCSDREYQRYISRARAHIQQFSWTRSAQIVLDTVYAVATQK